MAKKTKIKSPLDGSEANVCTEFNMPDLTRNVPIKLKENVSIDKRITHDCKIFFFSRMITQWNKAVPASHGIKDAFSTGSQNQ